MIISKCYSIIDSSKSLFKRLLLHCVSHSSIPREVLLFLSRAWELLARKTTGNVYRHWIASFLFKYQKTTNTFLCDLKRKRSFLIPVTMLVVVFCICSIVLHTLWNKVCLARYHKLRCLVSFFNQEVNIVLILFGLSYSMWTDYHFLVQRFTTHSPLATCGEWPFKCGKWLCFKKLQK